MIILRSYQEVAVCATRDMIRRGIRRILLQAETGAGKSVCAAEFLRLAYLKGSNALFIAHRRELVNQASRVLQDHGVPHGIIMSKKPMTPGRIQLASKDTLLAWGVREAEIELPPAQLVIPDEAHLTGSPMWQKLLQHYHDAVIVGLTATPAQGDGRGLGGFYQGMHCAIPTSALLEQGFLVPSIVLAMHRPDLRRMPMSGHDYNQKELTRKLDRPKLVGDIVKTWQREAADRQTILFASGISHSENLVHAFREVGVRACHIDGSTHPDDREKVLKDLAAGYWQVVSNVGVLPEGVDVPIVSCAIIARPTKSFVLWRQMCGRIKRPYPGKDKALVLDHAGNVFAHGHPDRDVEWTLDPTEKVRLAKPREPGEPHDILCPKCFCVFRGSRICPKCGYKIERQLKHVHHKKDELLTEMNQVEMQRMEQLHTPEAKIRFWHQCLACMAFRGQTTGAAAQMYKRHYGCFPEDFLPNMPRGHEWRLHVAKLYPQYLEKKGHR